ncbi:MAG: hypothetical protein KF716_34645 [Anaerolineae bacterium]|nr:hypothetical protein [Anaerolineae bacterium]
MTVWIITIGLLLTAASIRFPEQIQAQEPTGTPTTTGTPILDATVTPAATAQFTPSPTPLAVEPVTHKIFDDISFASYELNSIAVDAEDNIFVPDGNRYVRVFTREFEEFRRIPVPQAVSVAFNRKRDVLLVGRHYPATIEQLDPVGRSLGTLWVAPNTTLDCIGVDQKDMIYAIYTSINAPFAQSMIKLDPKGNIIFVRDVATATSVNDTVYAMTFEPDGTLNVTASGYGRDPILLSFWQFSPAGDRLTGRPRAYFTTLLMRPPGYPLRLPDGKLVMYNGDGLGFWQPDGHQISFTYWIDTAGGPPRQSGKHGGIALSADGETVYYADITETDKLVLGRTRLAE